MKVRIRAARPFWHIDFSELVRYRDLLWFLVRRDLTAVYRQTVIGPAWFLIQPLLTTIVFTVIFGQVANISTDGIPHFIFYMSGLIFWNYFAGVMNGVAGSMIGNAAILTKVYVPRLIPPFSQCIVFLAHMALNGVTFAGVYLWLRVNGASIVPTTAIGLLPVYILHSGLLGLGCGLWIASGTVKYRDFKFMLPFLTQLWMYATPIVYPLSLVENRAYRIVLMLNPMTCVVESARYALTGNGGVGMGVYGISVLMTLMILIGGVLVFNAVQRTLADTI